MDEQTLDEHTESVEDKSLEVTERAAVATDLIADRVCETVKEMGEQLRHDPCITEEIGEDLTLVERDISEMERPWWCCCCWRPCKRRRRERGFANPAVERVEYTTAELTTAGSAQRERPIVRTRTEKERVLNEHIR